MADASEPPTRKKKTKSSLDSHTFPPFYACYLLRSMKSPKATSTYIGSTPHPPRRIRQHNGELSQGAWKTSRGRPWVMAMIVHGFPSKLAALQFEWAWQHPDLSRHLRGKEIAKGRSLKQNIMVVYLMLTSQHYSSWPLQVKLFTSEAVKCWETAHKSCLNPLPPGLTCTIELEGVDGKSGQVGTGRTGPIDVMDAKFISEHLSKHFGMLSISKLQSCVVCSVDMDVSSTNPLSITLCPNSKCVAYAHLACLANSFLASSGEPPTLLIPRGGVCKACKEYTLWGDIIRGCYRRFSASAKDTESREDGADTENLGSVTSSPVKKRNTKTVKAARVRPTKAAPVSSDDEEVFDIDDISSDSVLSSPQGRVTKRLATFAEAPDETESLRSVASSPVKGRGPKLLVTRLEKSSPFSLEKDRIRGADDMGSEKSSRSEQLSKPVETSNDTRPTQSPLSFNLTKRMGALAISDETVFDIDEMSSDGSEGYQEIVVGTNNRITEGYNTFQGSRKPLRDSKPVDIRHCPSVIEISD